MRESFWSTPSYFGPETGGGSGSGAPPAPPADPSTRERRRAKVPYVDESVKHVKAEARKLNHTLVSNFFEQMSEGWGGEDPRVSVLLRILSAKIFRYVPGGAEKLAERLDRVHTNFLDGRQSANLLEAQKPFLMFAYLLENKIVFKTGGDEPRKDGQVRKTPDLFPPLGSKLYIDMKRLEEHALDFLSKLEQKGQLPDPSDFEGANVFVDIFDEPYFFGKAPGESAFGPLFMHVLKPDIESLRQEEFRTKAEAARAAFRRELMRRLESLGIDTRASRLNVEYMPGAALSDGTIELIIKDMTLSNVTFVEGSSMTRLPEEPAEWERVKASLIRALRLDLPPSAVYASWVSYAPDFHMKIVQHEGSGTEKAALIDRNEFGIVAPTTPEEALERLKQVMPPPRSGEKMSSRSIAFGKEGGRGRMRAYLNGELASEEVEEAALTYFRSLPTKTQTELYERKKHLIQIFGSSGVTWDAYMRGGKKSADKYLAETRPDYVHAEFPEGTIVLQGTLPARIVEKGARKDLLNERARMRAVRLRETMGGLLDKLLISVDEARLGIPATGEASDKAERELELFIKFVALRSKQRLWDMVHKVMRAESLLGQADWTPADLTKWLAGAAKRLEGRTAKSEPRIEDRLILELNDQMKSLTGDGEPPVVLLDSIRELRMRRHQDNYLESLKKIDTALSGIFAGEKEWSAVGDEGIKKIREDARAYLEALKRGKVKQIEEGSNFVKTFCTSYLGVSFSKDLVSEGVLLTEIKKVEEKLRQEEKPLRNEIPLSDEEQRTINRILTRLDDAVPHFEAIGAQMQVLEHAQKLGVWDEHPRWKTFEEYLAIVEKELVNQTMLANSVSGEIDKLTTLLASRQTRGLLLPWALIKAGNIVNSQKAEATRAYVRLKYLSEAVQQKPLVSGKSKVTFLESELTEDQERIAGKKHLISEEISRLFGWLRDPQKASDPEIKQMTEDMIDMLSQALSSGNEGLLDSALAAIKELE